jgi:predicted nucleotidyltransferase
MIILSRRHVLIDLLHTRKETMKREEVLRILREQKAELVESYQITYLSIFGSIAHGEPRPGEGVGILVKFAHPTGLFKFIDLKRHLEKLLGCKVDIGKPHSIRPHLKSKILQEAIRIF